MRYVDTPPPIVPFLDIIDLRLGKNVCAAALRERQVVHVQRVFCTDIATGNAIATVDAFVFDNTLAVAPVDFDTFLLEIDGKGESLNRLAQFRSAFLKSLEFF